MPTAPTTASGAARSWCSPRRPGRRPRRPTSVGETGEIEPVELEDVVARGAALVIRAGGGRAGESFPLETERLTIGRRPDSDIFLDDVTVSRDHAMLVRRGERLPPRRLRLAQRHLREPPPDRVAPAAGRRRAADRQVQARVPEPLMAAPDTTRARGRTARAGRRRGRAPPRQKSVTIGAVCKALVQEFPDISISKIRYLEDQKLLAPAAHAGRLPALHARTTSSACGRSCASSATSSCRCE